MSEPITTKHPHGGGRVGRFATVSPEVYVRADSLVEGNCELYGDEIFVQQESHLEGWCRLLGHTIVAQSSLSGFVQLVNTQAIVCELSGDLLAVDSEISRSNLSAPQGQQIRIINSNLNGVSVFGPVFIQGAKVENCELLPCVRIYGGTWDRSPKIKRSPFQFDCIESHIEGNLIIGCWDKPLAQWKQMVEIYRRVGDRMATAGEAIQWDDRDVLGGFEKLTPEELSWYADAIEGWSI